VLHEGSEEPESITITRAVIDVPSVLGDRRKPDDRWDFLLDPNQKIGYIRITSFIQNTAEDLKKVLDELKEQGLKGLILDLRDDPGGLLSAAVEVSDLFLDKGEIVSTKGRNTSPKTYLAQKDSPYEELPLVLLVNQNSASASEIVSAALQDHHRATVVGQRSYGKGSVQNIFDLDDGKSVLKLTVASYYRPSGENIHRFRHSKTSDKWGVAPDKEGEVKLGPSEYFRWAFARRERDLATGLRRAPASPPDAQKAKSQAQPGSTQEPAQDKTAAKKDQEKARAKGRSPHPAIGPFVDKQRDKALELLRAKLAEAEKAKAA
jgi:carboxyl-terminal processing protease